MDFGKIGVLQIGDERVAIRPLTMEHHYNEPTILTAELLPGVFDHSNYIAKCRQNKFARFAYGVDFAISRIENVIFNDPATIVNWADGSKTVVKCQPGESYSKEIGLAMCIAKKHFGNKGNFNEVFKKWIPDYDKSKNLI